MLQPRGALRLFIGVLQNAVRWTEIGLVNDDGVDAALYLQSPELSIFLQPAAMSVPPHSQPAGAGCARTRRPTAGSPTDRTSQRVLPVWQDDTIIVDLRG